MLFIIHCHDYKYMGFPHVQPANLLESLLEPNLVFGNKHVENHCSTLDPIMTPLGIQQNSPWKMDSTLVFRGILLV